MMDVDVYRRAQGGGGGGLGPGLLHTLHVEGAAPAVAGQTGEQRFTCSPRSKFVHSGRGLRLSEPVDKPQTNERQRERQGDLGRRAFLCGQLMAPDGRKSPIVHLRNYGGCAIR